MKLADYVIVAVILIWFCIAVRIIIKNRGGCGCGTGSGGNCPGCGACGTHGKRCSGCNACKEGRKKGNPKEYGMGKNENKTERCPVCGMTESRQTRTKTTQELKIEEEL